MYNAVITTITSVEPLPNSDNLVWSKIAGYDCIMGKEFAKVGKRVALFPPDGQLSEEYAKANDLVAYKDEQGNKKGGYFEANRRVKATRLRGSKSEAYIADIESFKFTGVDLTSLKDGFEFDTLNGIPICNKYYTPATQKAMKNNQKQGKPRKENVFFKKHFDTDQYKSNKKNLLEGAVVYITEKLHGTSARVGRVLDEKDKSGWFSKKYNALAWKFNLPKINTKKMEYDYLIGSRNVVLRNPEEVGGFYAQIGASENFRFVSAGKFKDSLRKGETVYYEIVGYLAETTSIMPSVDTKVLKDKEFEAKYGKRMSYSYRCVPGQFDEYVYRITQTNEDGHIIELPYYQMLARCAELGLKTPPLLVPPFVYDGNLEKLDDIVSSVTEGPSVVDPTHIREGVVVRGEQANGKHFWAKNKAFSFLVLEGHQKSDDNYVDTEEIS